MTVTRKDLEDAVASYWGKKMSQMEQSQIAKALGAGTAGSVRGGKQFDPVAIMLAKFFLDAGYTAKEVCVTGRKGVTLPGYFRPTKQWDVVVTHRGFLVAAFELKALGGPSFGNNANNRVEEALGSAFDFNSAKVDGKYPGEKPWIGYFLMIEDHPKSRSEVAITKGPIPVDPVWKGLSYQDRLGKFCERLLDEKIYDAVCYLTTSSDDPGPRENTPAADWDHFSAAIRARISYLADLGYPKRD